MMMILIIHFEEDNFKSHSNQTYASLDNDFDYLKNRNDSIVSKGCSKEKVIFRFVVKLCCIFRVKIFNRDMKNNFVKILAESKKVIFYGE